MQIRNWPDALRRYDRSIMKQLSIVYALITGFLTVQAAEYALQEFDFKEIVSHGIVESVQAMPSVSPVTANAL